MSNEIRRQLKEIVHGGDLTAAQVKQQLERELDVARDERESAASALRAELDRSVNGADRKLMAALKSADNLERERIAGVRNLLTAALAAAKEAVSKAEAADHERFQSHNDLLSKMEQQAKDSQSTLDKLIGSLLTKEAFEAVVAGWQQWREQVDRRLNEGAGEKRGTAIVVAYLGWVVTTLIAVVAIVIYIIH
jgi:phosphopantetheinyl transferase (holo-ACP synthase)